MLSAGFWILTLAAIAGVALAGLHLRATAPEQRPPWLAGAAHGLAGAAGVAALLYALATRAPNPAQAANGTGQFGWIAGALLGAALLAGLAVPLLRARHTGAVIAVHGALAVAGYVILLAFISPG
jgi:hypothetical protein